MQRFQVSSRCLCDARRGLLRVARSKWRLWVVLQHQLDEPGIVLPKHLRSDAKAKIDSGRNATCGDAVAVLHDTLGDNLRSEERQDISHSPVRRRFVAA